MTLPFWEWKMTDWTQSKTKQNKKRENGYNQARDHAAQTVQLRRLFMRESKYFNRPCQGKIPTISMVSKGPHTGADLGGERRGCASPPPEMTCGFLIQLVFCKIKKTMWFIDVDVDQETSAPPPKKNPGSAPDIRQLKWQQTTQRCVKSVTARKKSANTVTKTDTDMGLFSIRDPKQKDLKFRQGTNVPLQGPPKSKRASAGAYQIWWAPGLSKKIVVHFPTWNPTYKKKVAVHFFCFHRRNDVALLTRLNKGNSSFFPANFPSQIIGLVRRKWYACAHGVSNITIITIGPLHISQ